MKNKPLFILAPMVDNSGLEWRFLARKYGASLCYTEMVHCSKFLEEKSNIYFNRWYVTCKNDRPLAVQLCGNDPVKMAAVARMVSPVCDKVDINFGCPQNVARRGRYGAFLQDDWKLTSEIVRRVSEAVNGNEPYIGYNKNFQIRENCGERKHLESEGFGLERKLFRMNGNNDYEGNGYLNICGNPILLGNDNKLSCKIRIFKDRELTLKYCEMIESSGCGFLVVHGRTRDQKGEKTGLASWEHIKLIKENLKIPVISNGNILFHEDIWKCLEYTRADGIMVGETHLYNPLIFLGDKKTVFDVLREYYDLILESKKNRENGRIKRKYLLDGSFVLKEPILMEGGSKMCEIRSHTFKLLHTVLSNFKDYYQQIGSAKNLDEILTVVNNLKKEVGDVKYFPEPYIRS